MDTHEKKPRSKKQAPKEPKEVNKKDKIKHFCEIKYYLDYPEEIRNKMFIVRFD